MTDEITGSSAKPTWRDLTGAINDLRTEQTTNLTALRVEQKQDLKDMEGRLLTAFNNMVDEFRNYRTEHATQHNNLDSKGTAALASHIETTALASAKTDGRNEFLISSGKFVGNNWKALVVAAVGAWAFLSDFDLKTFADVLKSVTQQ